MADRIKDAAHAPLRVTLAETAGRLSAQDPFATIFEDGTDIAVELYAPIGTDRQTPHERDELYIVATGSGTFSRGDEIVSFGPGDLLYVPAYMPHRFESFSAILKVWVIFYGPKRQQQDG